jgi:hypothetical protein
LCASRIETDAMHPTHRPSIGDGCARSMAQSSARTSTS